MRRNQWLGLQDLTEESVDKKLAAAVASARRALAELTIAVNQIDRRVRYKHRKVIRLLRPPAGTEVSPAQERGIIDCLVAAGGVMTEYEFMASLPKFIRTVQKPNAVFNHYRYHLINLGIIAEEFP